MQWSNLITPRQLLDFALKTTELTSFEKTEAVPLSSKTKVIITHFELKNNTSYEIWLEFSIPKGDGIVEGTYVALLSDNDIKLVEVYGLHYV